MRRILSVCVLIMLMCLNIGNCYGWSSDYIKQMVNKSGYLDITDTSWAYESVNAMSQKGIVKGYPDGSFKPQATLTYGEFIKMVLIAETGEDVGNSKTGNWALNYYNKASELGYFSHNDIKANQLNKAITRTDMALIISNILGEIKIENYSKLENSLKDINSTVKNDYDIIKVYAKGIIT
ncbi:MAG: S-layer homology domain-containing protein, partial [Aminipila sp.]